MNEDRARKSLELNDLLAIDDFVLVEDSYAGQKWLDRTLEYMRKVKADDVVEAIRISDEQNGLLGIAIRDKDLGFWIIFTDIIADSARRAEFETLTRGMCGAQEREVTVKREQFHEGVIEFYSVGLVNRIFCDCDLKEESFYPRDRVELLKTVISEFLREKDLNTGDTKRTLEIGCGNGGATIALHELGLSPLTIDINRCEICQGLENGVLEPRRSIVLDCSLLSSFFGKEFDLVFGFMVGKLTPFERFTWEKVLREVPKVLKKAGNVLLTVSSEEEALIVKEILHDSFEAELKENKGSEGYFDLWLYIGKLK